MPFATSSGSNTVAVMLEPMDTTTGAEIGAGSGAAAAGAPLISGDDVRVIVMRAGGACVRDCAALTAANVDADAVADAPCAGAAARYCDRSKSLSTTCRKRKRGAAAIDDDEDEDEDEVEGEDAEDDSVGDEISAVASTARTCVGRNKRLVFVGDEMALCASP